MEGKPFDADELRLQLLHLCPDGGLVRPHGQPMAENDDGNHQWDAPSGDTA